MRRARLKRLALVNWRNVFYERYELNSNVTAFEGANAAGKTTVMMAACVALLPDMKHLRFTSGTHHPGTSGKEELWGRLGKTGGPSYTVLDIELGTGERLLAGVHLERRSEPSIDLTPFLILGLPPHTRLQPVLLGQSGESESVPEIDELRDQAARHGAQLQRCATAKEYFKALFDRGVTPLRLDTDTDRRKLAEMLQTSMDGGLSPALTSELRSFLLREQSGLSDAIKRMRANIRSCKHTRTIVEENKAIESEVSQVYEAGQNMFNAAVHATRQRAEELARHAAQARTEARGADEAFEAATARLEEVSTARDRAQAQLSELEQGLADERRDLERLREAQKIRERIDAGKTLLCEATERYAASASAHSVAWSRHENAQTEHRRRLGDLEQAAVGLADLEKGVERLYWRAGEHRSALRALNDARDALPDAELSAESAPEALERVRAERKETSEELNTLETELSHVETRRREHGDAMQALNTLTEDDGDPGDAHARARKALERMRNLEAEAQKIEELAAATAQAAARAREQERVRKRALVLSDENHRLQCQADVVAAHDDAQRGCAALAEEDRGAERVLDHAMNEAAAANADIHRLEDEATRWRAARRTAEGLERTWRCALGSRDEIGGLRARLDAETVEAREALQHYGAEKHELETEQALLGETGGKVAPEIAALREQVGGDLLAASYEDIAIEDAATAEARLGALAGAIVVDDPESAAVDIVQVTTRPDSVWLVARSAAPDAERNHEGATHVFDDDVIVEGEDGAWRVTRKPDKPILGRRARAKRLEEIEERLNAAKADVTQARQRVEVAQEAQTTTDTLLAQADLLESGDPAPKLEAARRRAEQSEADATAHRKTRARLAGAIASETRRLEALNALLRDAWLLDGPSYRDEHEALGQRLSAARAAKKQLDTKAAARVVLEATIDVLRAVPPSQEKEQELRERLASRTRRARDLTTAQRALEEALRNPAALGWTDAQGALDEKRGLVPTLRAQLDQAKMAADHAHAALKTASEAFDNARRTLNAEDARVKTCEAELERAEAEWNRLGIEDASEAAIAAAETRVATLGRDRDVASNRHTTLIESVGTHKTKREQAETTRTERRKAVEQHERAARPARERWERLRADADGHGVLATTLDPKVVRAVEHRGSVNLFADARGHAMRLKDRLAMDAGQRETLTAIEALLEALDRGGSDEALPTWIQVRSWLLRRIPAHIAQDDDPLEALGRLRRYLDRLIVQLTRQEGELQGESADVANTIGIHIRQAHRDVSRLNDDLREVRFGSIAAVRLKLERVQQMQDTLEALRKGEDQKALFQTETHIEEALDALLARHGGRRGQGHKLLDYREYIEPQVEVMRQAGGAWEKASAIRISTGESIGIGAALMMVVLTAWERNANLLRSSRAHGTLRVLFLDEANRLDRDNLGVLFNLCQSLNLQLLIAAPEVAETEGNTTYRLVRRSDGQGDEEVFVTGRRPKAAKAA